jgi:hypothetical protein
MKTLKAVIRAILWTIAVLAGLVVVAGFIPFSSSKTLPNGATLRITHAPEWLCIWAFVFNTRWWPHCTVTYRPASGPGGRVVFWEDFADWPQDVFLSSDGHSILCLYDYDISVPLFKFDPGKPFDPSLVTDNIKHLVCTTPWQVQEAGPADWQDVRNALTAQNVSGGWISDYVTREAQKGNPPPPGARTSPTP